MGVRIEADYYLIRGIFNCVIKCRRDDFLYIIQQFLQISDPDATCSSQRRFPLFHPWTFRPR